MSFETRAFGLALAVALTVSTTAHAAHVVLFSPDATANATGDTNHVVTSTSGTFTAQVSDPGLSGNSASSYASLPQGILRAYAASGSAAFAQSSFHDTVYFNNTSGDYVQLGIVYSIDGDISQNPAPFPSRIDDSAALIISSCGACGNVLNQPIQIGTSGLEVGDDIRMSFNRDGVTGFQDFGNPIDPLKATVGSSFVGGHYAGFISTSVRIPTGLTSLGVGADLLLDCRSGGVCDFGHTGRFSFGAIPGGLSFTSASGAFLTAPIGGVPEPEAWTLMLTGFGGLGAVLRRRRSVAGLAATWGRSSSRTPGLRVTGR